MNKYKAKNNTSENSFLVYIAPITFIIIFFWIIPILISFFLSLTKYTGFNIPSFIRFDNYKNLFKDKIFIESLKNTIIFIIFIVPGQTVLAFFIAAWIYKSKNSMASRFVKWTVLIPSLVPSSVLGLVFRILLNNPQSPINNISQLFGISANNLLGTKVGAMATVVIISVLVKSGYYSIIFHANMLDIPKSCFETAEIDGVGQFNVYKDIIFPLMKPSILLVLFLNTIDTFQQFDLIYTLTGGGPGTSGTMTVMVYLYLHGFKYSKIGYSMAIGNIMILIVILISIVQRKNLIKQENQLY